jgi:hypothetical protein
MAVIIANVLDELVHRCIANFGERAAAAAFPFRQVQLSSEPF